MITEAPYRIVDVHNQGWLTTGPTGEPGHRYRSYHRGAFAEKTLAELERDCGPVRPVEPITNEDEDELAEIFGATGRKTVGTICAALEEVFHAARESKGGLNDPTSYEYAERTLTAGRPGSWESEVLKELVWFGNELNLAPAKRGANERGAGASVEARRRNGPSKRVNVATKQALVDMFTRWVSDPARYTEVAETLAAVVSGYADDAGAAGWQAIADQWLQPGGLALANFRSCYRLLYSQSAHFDSGLL